MVADMQKKVGVRSVLALVYALVFLGGCSSESDHVSARGIVFDSVFTAQNVIPVLVIGSGPAGRTAAAYTARNGFATVVFEGNKPGGLLTETTYVENWPGRVRQLGTEIMEDLAEQARAAGALLVRESVTRIDGSRWPYAVTLADGQVVHALAIIIATGAAPRRLAVPGWDEYWGKDHGITSCAICDAPNYKNRAVVIVGGGDSATEMAEQLAPHARHITILVRKDHMRASESRQKRVQNLSNVTILYEREIERITGNGVEVTSVEVRNHATNSVESLPVSGVFVAIGHDPNSGLVKGIVDCDTAGYIQVQGRTQKTSKPGIFAAGDVQDHTYRQAGTAAGFGICAALDAGNFLQEIGFNPAIAQQLAPQLWKPGTVARKTLEVITKTGDFDRAIARTDKVIVVDFFAQYCRPCLNMLPIVEEVAARFSSSVQFYKADVDEVPELADRMQVVKVPCIIVYKNGEMVARLHKAMDRAELTALVSRFVA